MSWARRMGRAALDMPYNPPKSMWDPTSHIKTPQRILVQAMLAAGSGMSYAGGMAGRAARAVARPIVNRAADAVFQPGFHKNNPLNPISRGLVGTLAKPGVGVLLTVPALGTVITSTGAELKGATRHGLSAAQAAGESGMYRHSANFAKTAGWTGAATTALGQGVKPATDILQRMFTKNVTKDITKDMAERLIAKGGGPPNFAAILEEAEKIFGAHNVIMDPATMTVKLVDQQLNTGMMAGVGALGLAGAGAVDVIGPTIDTLGYQVQKQLTPGYDRAQVEDEAFKGFAAQGGRGVADIVTGLLGGAVNSATTAASNAALTFSQSAVLSRVMSNDPMLRSASGQEKEMLQRAFASMVRFAPDVSTDEFAVKNFLREALMSSNGPDYATIGNLAKVNQSIVGDRR